MGYNEGTRGDFHTLCPGNKIKRQVGRARFIYFWVYCITTFIDNTMSWGCCQIVTWMALKATWLQQHIFRPSLQHSLYVVFTWCNFLFVFALTDFVS